MVSASNLLDDVKKSLSKSINSVTGVGGAVQVVGQLKADVVLGEHVVKQVDVIVVESEIPTLIGLNVLRHRGVSEVSFSFDTMTLSLVNGSLVTVNLVDRRTSVDRGHSFYSVPKFKDLPSKVKWIQSKLGVDVGGDNNVQVEQMADLIIKYNDVFGSEDNMGCYPHPVELKTQGNPISARQHPISHKFKDKVDDEISRMLKLKVIEPIDDPDGWCTPIVIVSKKDGSARVVANYKLTLNKRLVAPEPFNVPSCDELLAHASPKNTLFSSMDLYHGYWQLLIKESDRKKTAFQWKGQFYQYVRLPMGYHCSGNLFAKCVHQAMSSSVDPSKVLIYLDDIHVLDDDWESFVSSHERVFKALRANNLRLKGSKCHFNKKSIKFLGRVMDKNGITADPEQVKAVQLIQPPRNKRELLQLQGRLSFLRAFVGTRMGESVKKLNFSELFEPIYAVGRTQPFKWTSAADKALNKLKVRLSTSPFISLPDPSKPFILACDASLNSIGGVLMQQISPTQNSVVSLVSKCLDPVQRRWSTLEREAFALLYCVEKFEHWLRGNTFTVRVDHRSLVYLDQKVFKNVKLARWQERLSKFSFVCQYIAGESNILADWFSRLHPDEEKVEPDSTPQGQFLQVKGTDGQLKIYVPSWCSNLLHKSTVELENELTCQVPSTDTRNNTDRGLAAFVVNRTIVNTSLIGEVEDLVRSQRHDSFLNSIITTIESGHCVKSVLNKSNDKRAGEFIKIHNQLQICPTTRLLVKCDKYVQIVLSPCDVSKYLRIVHDNSGHGGFDVCKSRLKTVWWPGLNDDLKLYVRSCQNCAARKGRYGQRAPQSGVCEKGTKPFEIVFIDFIQLPPSNGMKYAMTLIDSFSRFVRVYPSRGCSADDTCAAIKKFVVEFGTIPRIIHSDRGRHFVGEVFTQLCKELNIVNKLHVAFRPQSSGLVERMHRSLKNSLYITSHQLDRPWIKVLDLVVLCVNSNVHSGITVSPFMCIYGREAAIDTISFNQPAGKNPEIYKNELQKQLTLVRKTVRLCNDELDRRAKSKQLQVDKTDYQVGDKVLIWREMSRKKTAKGFDWIGPGKIVNVYDLVVEVEIDDKCDLISLHHIRKVPERPKHLDYDPYEDFDVCIMADETTITSDTTFGGGEADVENLVTTQKVESPTKIKNVAKTEPESLNSSDGETTEEFYDADSGQNSSLDLTIKPEIKTEIKSEGKTVEKVSNDDPIENPSSISTSTPLIPRNDGERPRNGQIDAENKTTRAGRTIKQKKIFDPSDSTTF